MRNWFDTLEVRERLFVMVGGFVVLCAVLFFLVWMPTGHKLLSPQWSQTRRDEYGELVMHSVGDSLFDFLL